MDASKMKVHHWWNE